MNSRARLRLTALVSLTALFASAPATKAADASQAGAVLVPSPFAPVLATGFEEGSGGSVEIWGRLYRFTLGPLPSSIVTQGQSLLARPASFRVDLGEGEQEVGFGPPSVERSTLGAVLLVAHGRAGKLDVEARTTIEYDGMLRVNLRLRGESLRIVGFRYEIPLQPAAAEFYNHHIEYDYQALNVDKESLLESAGRLTPAGLERPFVPTIAIGNREIGLEWMSETDADWSVRPSARPIRLGVAPDAVTLEVQPIAQALTIGQAAWSHTFALFPLPMRPSPRRWHSNRFVGHGSAARFDRSIGIRYVSIVFPPGIDAKWHGLPETRPSPSQRQLRADAKAVGEAYIPYGKLTAAPSFHPETLENADSWAANRQRFVEPPPDERAVLVKTEGWKPREPYGYAVCFDAPGYLDFMLESNLRTLEEEKTDGLYFDFGAITRPCMPKDGSGHPRWPYFALRDFYRRLYEGMSRKSPQALLTIHTHGQPRSLGAWADYVFVGEALYDVFRQSKPAAQYDADYFSLPAGFIDALFFPQVGGRTALLPEVRFGDADVDRLRRSQRGLHALTLVRDIPIWVANSYNEEAWSVLRALDRFGNLDEATFHPWWRTGTSEATPGRLRVSYHARPDRVLAVVANESDQPFDGSVGVPWQSLGMPPLERWKDLERPKREDVRVSDGRIKLTVPPHDFRLLLLK